MCIEAEPRRSGPVRVRGRGRGAMLGALILLVAGLPPAPVHAAPEGPILLSPVGETVTSVFVDFRWQRVEGASRYHIQVWHGSPSGTLLVNEYTVNERFIAPVNLSGDVAYWSVASIDAGNDEGPATAATFTTLRQAADLIWPPDGATLSHPDIAVTPQWTGPPYQAERTAAVLDDGSSGPLPDSMPRHFTPGTWRWGVRGNRAGPGLPTAPSSEIRTFSYTWPGSVPTLSAPADGTTSDTGDFIRLEWETVPGAAFYAWELANVDVPTIVIANYNGARANWADIAGPLVAGRYEWRVRAVMSGTVEFMTGVAGPWSEVRSLTITEPPAATLTVPTDGAHLDRWPLLRWEPVPGATSYSLQIATTPDPSVPIVSPAALGPAFAFRAPADATDLSAASPSGGTRHWRVRANGGTYADGFGDWSEWRSFSVDPAAGTLSSPVATTLQGPEDCVTDACPDIAGRPLLSWAPVAKAAFYRVFLRWDGGSGAADEWIDVGSASLPLQRYNSVPGSRTAWAVVACPAECPTDMPAERRHFRIGFPAPAQLGPPDGTVQGAPNVSMSWSEIADAPSDDVLPADLSYELEYSMTPGEFSEQSVHRTTGKTTHGGVDAIRNGVTIAWRVRATAFMGWIESTPGAWSPWRTIRREEPPLVLVSPADRATVSAIPTLDWEDPGYSVLSYRVEVVRLEALSWYGPDYWDWAAHTGATAIRTRELAPGTYRWRVQRQSATYHSADGSGQWSSGTFTVEGDPELHPVSPSANESVRADDVVLSWLPYPTNPNYTVLIGATPDVRWDTAIYSGGTAATMHAVPTLLPPGDLYWRVCASERCSEAAGFSSGHSEVRVMHVTAAPNPDASTPVTAMGRATPRLGSTIGSTGAIPVVAAWTASDIGTGIASQQLEVRRGAGSWTAIAVSPTARSAALSLLPGSTYSVRIRAIDWAGNTGAWSSTQLQTGLVQETSALWRWSSGWTRSLYSGASGGGTRWSQRAGATATISLTAKSLAVVAPKSATRGSAEVWIDGVRVATIRLDTSPMGSRKIAYARTWATASSHRVTIRVIGTPGHPRVDIDAIVAIR